MSSDPQPSRTLEDYKRLDREFASLIEDKPTEHVVGLIGPLGSGLIQSQGEPWRLTFVLMAWRLRNGEVHKDRLRVEATGKKGDLENLQKCVQPYRTVRLTCRIAQHPAGRLQAQANSVTLDDNGDDELQAYAVELQKPVTHQDAVLGELTLDRRFDCFEGKCVWQGETIDVSLDGNDASSLNTCIDIAHRLWMEQPKWSALIAEQVISDLLDLKNDAWLDEDNEESPLAPEVFTSRIGLESICIHHDGNLEFWFDDGDLFWGHAIHVRGHVEGGISDAELCG